MSAILIHITELESSLRINRIPNSEGERAFYYILSDVPAR